MRLDMLAVAFLSLFALDVCWAVYAKRITEGRAYSASSWAVALYLLGAVTTLLVVDDWRNMIGSGLGAWAGTFAGVWWTNRTRTT
jgi:hypothetical protein